MDLTASDYKKIASYYQIPKSKNKTYKITLKMAL